MKIAIVRGKFLNHYEMQIFESLAPRHEITAFGSLTPFHDRFVFPTVKLPSPMDLPEFPFKMPLLNRIFTDAQYLFELEQELRGFDIVHTAETYYHYTQQSLNAKKKGYVKKVVATVLENIPFNNEGILGRKEYKKRARQELDHMIALTNRTKDALILEGADPNKITVIGHGIDTSVFVPGKKIYDKKTKQITLLFIGRLEVYKGIYELIYAMKLLLLDKELRQYKITLLMIGEGSEKEKLISFEKQLGLEEIISHKTISYSEIPMEYHNADMYVAPSKASATWQEQYNTTLLEAQASGMPIVTTMSGGIPENVADAALLVSPGDVTSLKEAIKQFILDPKLRREYATKARKRAVEIHDAKQIGSRIEKIYESC